MEVFVSGRWRRRGGCECGRPVGGCGCAYVRCRMEVIFIEVGCVGGSVERLEVVQLGYGAWWLGSGAVG